MQLICLGSSSSGNGYILNGKTSALVIECGVPLKDLINAVDFQIMKVAGAIISHSHGDHSKHVIIYLNNASLNIYTSKKTGQELKISDNFLHAEFKSKEQFQVGEFTILPFPLKHDVECHGFLIQHPECGKVLFATDSFYIPFKFSGVNHLVLEANFDEQILQDNIDAGKLVSKQIKRIYSSHMSIETCLDVIRANYSHDLRTITLIHLSSGNSNAISFKKSVEQEFGIRCYIADKGVRVEL